jgi:tungstate transport system substrate-binding protein
MGLALKMVFALLLAFPVQAQEKAIIVASTTSTEQSGLFRHLLPAFKKESGIAVRVVAVGTGQALDMGRRGDADVVFVHDKAAELQLAAEGYFVGPGSDPAGARGKDVVAAFKHIAASRAPFVSRGDRSGTHAAELRLWQLAGVRPERPWYRETGSGMGPTLNTASGMNAYALTDRGTWIFFKNRGELAVLVEGDERLFNQYGVMLVNPARHPHVKKEMGQAFIDWLASEPGQRAIASYRLGGEPLFFPNAQE